MHRFGHPPIHRSIHPSIHRSGGGPGHHLLNLGHGVIQGTPEESVGFLVDEAKLFGVEAAKESRELLVAEDASLVV